MITVRHCGAAVVKAEAVKVEAMAEMAAAAKVSAAMAAMAAMVAARGVRM